MSRIVRLILAATVLVSTQHAAAQVLKAGDTIAVGIVQPTSASRLRVNVGSAQRTLDVMSDSEQAASEARPNLRPYRGQEVALVCDPWRGGSALYRCRKVARFINLR